MGVMWGAGETTETTPPEDARLAGMRRRVAGTGKGAGRNLIGRVGTEEMIPRRKEALGTRYEAGPTKCGETRQQELGDSP